MSCIGVQYDSYSYGESFGSLVSATFHCTCASGGEGEMNSNNKNNCCSLDILRVKVLQTIHGYFCLLFTSRVLTVWNMI